MSESNPIKITPPTPAIPKQDSSSVDSSKNEETKPISIQPPKKTPDLAKVSQPIRIPSLFTSDQETAKPNSIGKAELQKDSTQRMGSWFQPKKKQAESDLSKSPPKSGPIQIPAPSPLPVVPELEPSRQVSSNQGAAKEEKKGEESAFPWVARDRSDEKPEILLPPIETAPIPIAKKGGAATPLPSPIKVKFPISEEPTQEKPKETETPKETVLPPVKGVPPFIQSTAPSPLTKPMESIPLEKEEGGKKEIEEVKSSDSPSVPQDQNPGLLSRKRYEEKGVKTEVPSKEPALKKAFPLWLRIILWILIPLAIAGIGYTYYLHYRETKLVGKLSISNLRLDRKIYIVNNFSADVHVLAGEYKERLQPVRDQIKDREVVVRRAKGDVSSIEERIKIVNQELGTIQKEIDLQMESGKSFQKRIWETEGMIVEKEYERQLDLFKSGVQERVKGLQIKWEPGDLRSPEVWANAFRLGLYDAPKGVKNSVEREWIEKELQKWREFETKWETGKENIRDRIDQYQAKINDKVVTLKERAQVLETKTIEANQELAPLREELASAEGDLKESQAEESNFLDYYYKQILELPEKNVRAMIDLRADNTFYWGKIHENKAFPAGNYLLFVRGKKGDEDYWTMIEFPLIEFHKTDIEITQSAFISIADYLK